MPVSWGSVAASVRGSGCFKSLYLGTSALNKVANRKMVSVFA